MEIRSGFDSVQSHIKKLGSSYAVKSPYRFKTKNHSITHHHFGMQLSTLDLTTDLKQKTLPVRFRMNFQATI
jgi:hypothetical protein